MNVKLCAMVAVYLLVLSAATAKVNGFVWYHSANLLQNSNASSLSVNPWTQGGGTWTVTSGPATLGSLSIDTSDGSPWFLNSGGVLINNSCSVCFKTRTVTLAQTINLSTSYTSLIQNSFSVHFVYGGDAFAEGMWVSGNGTLFYRYSEDYETGYRVDFLDGSGTQLAWDESGPIFNSNFLCAGPTWSKKNYGYRRTVTAIPTATRSIRFTATMMDRVSVCYSSSTTGTFKNGFDNLWLEFVYLSNSGRQSAQAQFKAGSAPGPSVKATLMRKPATH